MLLIILVHSLYLSVSCAYLKFHKSFTELNTTNYRHSSFFQDKRKTNKTYKISHCFTYTVHKEFPKCIAASVPKKRWILSARNTIVSFLCVWFRVEHLHFVNILLKHSLQLFFIFLPVQQGVCLKLFMATIQRYNKKCWKSKEQKAVSSWEKNWEFIRDFRAIVLFYWSCFIWSFC